jgi:hypothetical protein
MPMLLHWLFGVQLLEHVAALPVFGGVEELMPRPLHEFCDKEVKEGLRYCEGSVARMMEDGGIVKVNWALHADPDRILSIDIEQNNGAKILKCTPSTMELELPERLVRHAQVGELIVASQQSHTCEHYAAIDKISKEENPEATPIHDLYARITKVLGIQWLNADGSLAAGSSTGKKARVRLWTKELNHIGEAIPTVSYNFNFIPTTVPKEHEAARKQLGEQWEAAERNKAQRFAQQLGACSRAKQKTAVQAAERKLQDSFPTQYPQINVEDFKRPGEGDDAVTPAIKWRGDGGQPLITGQSVVTDDVKSLMNFRPKQVANFAWNWKFGVNSSNKHGAEADMWYNYSLHGAQMHLLIRKPLLKSSNSIQLKFRSYTPHENAQDAFFPDDNTWVQQRVHSSANVAKIFGQWEPRVKWIFEANGHGQLEAVVFLRMDSRLDNMHSNPIKSFPIPILKKFLKPKCFGHFKFYIGQFPISFAPCVEFEAKFFHYGRFHGSFGMGLNAHATYTPKMEFDSFAGLRVDIATSLTDVSITPPNWLLKTNHFECGIALEPSLSIAGTLGHNVRQSRAVVAFRPYVNMSILREEPNRGGIHYDNKELIIYPYRITGPLPHDLYMVRIETAAWQNFNHEPIQSTNWIRKVATRPSPYCGEVEFQDPVQYFSFGLVPQQDLLKLIIHVTIVRVSPDGAMTDLGTADLTCHSETNGVCQPSPMQAQFQGGVTVHLHAIWSDSPQSFFTSKFKGVSFYVPELVLNKHYIEKALPGYKIDEWREGVGSVSGSNAKQPPILVLTHGGKSYPVDMNKQKGYVPSYNSSSISSDTIFELGNSFLSTWDTACAQSQGTISVECDPRITVYIGNKEIAAARLPPIAWAGSTAKAQDKALMASAVLGAHFAGGHQVPVSIALTGTGGALTSAQNANAGLVRMLFNVAGPTGWNRFVYPRLYQTVTPGERFNLTWSLTESDTKAMPFRIKYLKKSTDDAFADPKLFIDASGNPQFVPQIGEWPFEEVKALMKDVTITPGDTSTFDALAISRSRYTYFTTLGAEFPIGSYMMIMIEWHDTEGFHHVMPSPPIRVVSPAQVKAIAKVEADEAKKDAEFDAKQKVAEITQNGPDINDISYQNNGGNIYNPRKLQEEERRLFWPFEGPAMSTPLPLSGSGSSFDDLFIDHRGGQYAECKKKELHFKYGAGIAFKAFIKHLTLPSDLPVLGGIDDAPEIGTPWLYFDGLTYATTPENLKDNLPRIFCRHGLCDAALPGCSEVSDRRTFYPSIDFTYKHTFRYSDIKKDETANALRQGLSYVFAVLPEAVHLILHYTNHSIEKQAIIGWPRRWCDHTSSEQWSKAVQSSQH